MKVDLRYVQLETEKAGVVATLLNIDGRSGRVKAVAVVVAVRG
jgi:hypothetical protein